MLKIGDAFSLPTPNNPKEHLWVIITEPDATTRAACVNMTSIKDWTPEADKHLVLSGGEHQFINKPTVVNYKDARLLYMNQVDKMLVATKDKIVCKQYDRCSDALLKTIQDSMPTSPADKKIKAYCANAWKTSY